MEPFVLRRGGDPKVLVAFSLPRNVIPPDVPFPGLFRARVFEAGAVDAVERSSPSLPMLKLVLERRLASLLSTAISIVL